MRESVSRALRVLLRTIGPNGLAQRSIEEVQRCVGLVEFITLAAKHLVDLRCECIRFAMCAFLACHCLTQSHYRRVTAYFDLNCI